MLAEDRVTSGGDLNSSVRESRREFVVREHIESICQAARGGRKISPKKPQKLLSAFRSRPILEADR
jgi:hypothetical protein